MKTENVLRGECCVCGRIITESDWDAQRVVATIGPQGMVCACSDHLRDGPDGPEYKRAVRRLAEATAEAMQKAGLA